VSRPRYSPADKVESHGMIAVAYVDGRRQVTCACGQKFVDSDPHPRSTSGKPRASAYARHIRHRSGKRQRS